jgi:glycosyltransferase involved in cell wall biosynthesis
MRKVLSIIHAPEWGGLHGVAERVAPACKEKGWEWTVLLPKGAKDSGRARLESSGIKVIEIPLRRIRRTKNAYIHLEFLTTIPIDVLRLASIIKKEKIDVVQIVGLIHFHGVIAAKLAGRPVVWQIHSDFPPPFLRKFFTPKLVKYADVIMAIGRGVVAAHPGLEAAAHKLVLFKPPIDTDRYKANPESRKEAREIFQISDDELMVGAVGQRIPRKGHALLVEAARIVRQTNDRVRFCVIGQPYAPNAAVYQEDVVDRADKYGLLANNAFAFYDAGSKVDMYLNGLDIFALPSQAEGMALSAAEAMSTGIPVVINDVGSMSELFDGLDAGFVNKSLTAEEMAEHILKLANDPELRAFYSQRARQQVLDKFTIEACANSHIEAYELCFKGQGSKPVEQS